MKWVFWIIEEENIRYFSQVMECNAEQFNLFFHAMLDKGIYMAPSAFESAFVSSAHSEEDLKKTIECTENSLKQ